MRKQEIIKKLESGSLDGFILGLKRVPDSDKYVSHIYEGPFHEPGEPLCPRGWNRGKNGYSIWRNNVVRGICKICVKNLQKQL